MTPAASSTGNITRINEVVTVARSDIVPYADGQNSARELALQFKRAAYQQEVVRQLNTMEAEAYVAGLGDLKGLYDQERDLEIKQAFGRTIPERAQRLDQQLQRVTRNAVERS